MPMQKYKVCLQAPHFIYSHPDKIRRHAKNLLVRATLFCPWHFFHYLCRLIMMKVQYKPLPILQVSRRKVTKFQSPDLPILPPSFNSLRNDSFFVLFYFVILILSLYFQNQWLSATMVMSVTTRLYPAT